MSSTPHNPPEGPPLPLRVLLIEHDAGDVELCRQTLRRAGFDPAIRVVSRKEELPVALRESEFDVVLSDYRMPEWTGMEALAFLQQQGYDLPFLLVTGTLGDESAVDCIKKGVTDYILKDRIARLPEAVRGALREKTLREERARVTAGLRASEERFRSVAETATDAIFIMDEQRLILYANSAASRIFGWPVQELLGKELTLLMPESFRERHRQGLRRYLETGVRRLHWECIEFPGLHRDGHEIPLEISYGEFRQNGRHLFTGIVRDIRERRTLERQLRQAQKFEAIGQLVGGIAHDFNNVIGAILGWAEMGMEETLVGTRPHSYFEKTRAQADRAAALIRQLLAFARRQVLEPRNLSLNQSVGEVMAMLETLLGKNIEVKSVLASDLAVIRADPTQIEQTLLNLCINARDAMPNGGRLVIETENVEIDEHYCRLHPYARPGRYVRLNVSDTGTGMDAATLDHIFEPFFTTKEPGRGTGLGLATTFGIVKQHCGFLHVYSEVGHGTVFRIYFPAVEAETDQPRKPTEETLHGGAETILIAEDHEGVRESACSALERLGYRVLAVPDGAAALDLFRRQPNRIDLALLDVVMPHLNGPEAYALMEVLRPALPVIFTSGYTAETQTFDEVIRRGLPVLAKPYSSSQLARKVRDTLDRRLAPAPASSASSPLPKRPRSS